MDFKICLTIFGIITFTNGRPGNDESAYFVTNENELQQLLKTITAGEGKFDIAFTHHEDGPTTHHEDKTQFSHHPETSHENHRHSHKHKGHHGSHHHASENQPSLTNIQTLNLFYKKKPNNIGESNYDDDSSSEDDLDSLLGLRNRNAARNGYDNVDEVIDLLQELDNNVANDNEPDERCEGGTCGIGRSGNDNNNLDDGNDNDDCRHGGCGANRGDGDDNYNKISFQCTGNRCGDDNDRNDNNLHCFGGMCGKAIRIFDDVDNYYNNVNRADDDRADDGLCNGGRCDTDQSFLRERRLPLGDGHLQHHFKPQPQKFKISDELDAMVLDISDLAKMFGNSHTHDNENEENDVKIIEDVVYENSHGSNRDFDSNLNSEPKAFVVDLGKTHNKLSKDMKGLVNKLQGPLKRKPVHLESAKKESFARGDSKILSHNEDNNNVYVPKWLLQEVITKANLRDSEQNLKNLLPLTAKQKEKMLKAMAAKKGTAKRIFRRSVQDDVGVPFHLEIQGLGQVNA